MGEEKDWGGMIGRACIRVCVCVREREIAQAGGP